MFTNKSLLTISLIILFLLYFWFYGNPISEYLATKNTNAYITKNYPNKEYSMGNASYNMKLGVYTLKVIFPKELNSFEITTDMYGNIKYDPYAR